MSRIGKNEATFKFFFGLSFQLVTRFVCGTSGWNHFFLIVFVDVGTLISFALDRICGCGCWCAGFSPTKKKRNGFVMWNRCCYLFLKKKSPKKKNMLIGVFFSFKKCVYRHLSSWFISPILTSSPDTWNRRQKSKSALCRIPSVLLTILQLSPLYDRIPLWSLTAKCYSLVHFGIEWMYFVNDFGATTKKKQMFNF